MTTDRAATTIGYIAVNLDRVAHVAHVWDTRHDQHKHVVTPARVLCDTSSREWFLHGAVPGTSRGRILEALTTGTACPDCLRTMRVMTPDVLNRREWEQITRPPRPAAPAPSLLDLLSITKGRRLLPDGTLEEVD